MVLRLSEQYLIRAEARAHLSNLTGSIDDLNIIRSRAGLTDLPSSLDEVAITAAIAQEKRIEFFAEWGHRWFDLKRTNTVDSIMTIATPLKNGNSTWQTHQQLYPIPFREIQRDRI